MSLRAIITRLASYSGGLLVLFLLVATPVEAAPTLSCGSTDSTLGEDFKLVSGEPLSLTCTLSGGEKDTRVMLLGKQQNPGKETSASGTDVNLIAGETTKTTLSFPPAFQNGTYTYTVSLFDTQTGQTIAKDVTLTGTLGSASDKQARIMTATVDKGAYQWGEAFTLFLSLDVPEDKPLTTAPLTATVTMEDKDGQVCSTLLDKKSLTMATESLPLTFPKESGTCVNAFTLTLEDKGGTILDKKSVAVGLTYAAEGGAVAPSQEKAVEPQASGLSILMIATLVFVAVFLVVLVGYAMMRKRRVV